MLNHQVMRERELSFTPRL